MPGFGRFDAYDEFGSRGPYAVWRARPAGTEGPGQFVVKTFLTQDMLADEEVVERRAARFIESANLQKSLAGEGWAPIEDSGRTTTHAFYVTAWYPTTLERVIDARVISGLADEDVLAAAKALVHVLSGVTQGLERLWGSQKRGHGNLKPSNVLIRTRDAGGADLTGAEVVLADPAPRDALAGDGMADDLRALADLLHRLVTGRESPDAGAVQVGPEWSRLGSPGPGEELRKVCEQLLNPQAGQALLTPAEIRERLAACLRAKMQRKSSPLPKILAGVAVLLIAGGVGAYVLLGKGERKRPPGEDPRLPDVAAWRLTHATRLEEATRTIAGVRPCMTDEQLARSDALAARLEEAGAKIQELGAAAWPQGQGEEIAAARSALEKAILEVEGVTRDVGAQAGVLKTEVGDCSEEVDPRRPDRQRWLTEAEGRMKAAVDAAVAELGAELAARSDADLQRSLAELRGRAEAASTALAGVREREWPVAGEGQAADSEAIKAAREARTGLRAEIQRLGGEVGQVFQAAEKATRDSQQRVGDYLEARRAERDQVVKSDRLKEAYGEAVRRLARKNPGWAQAKEQVDRIAQWLGMLERELGGGLQVAVRPGTAVDVAAAGEVMRAARERAIAEAVRPLEETGLPPESEAGGVAAQKTALQALEQEIREVLTRAGVIEELLDRASAYDEDVPGKGSIKALREQIEKAAQFGALERAVDRVLARARGLGEAAAVSDGAQARQRLEGITPDGRHGSEALTLWRTLVRGGFPATPADLAAAPALVRERVAPALSGLADKPRGEALTAEAIGQLRAMWTTFVHDKAKGDPAAVDAAFKSASAFGISEADMDGLLEPFAKFNLERWRLASAVEGVRGVTDRDQQIERLKGLAAGLQARAGALGVAQRSDVADLFANKRKLAPYLAGKFSNFEEVGPGSPSLPTRWTLSAQDEDNGLWAEYAWNGQRVRFVRVGEAEDPASFVSTTEVTVGVFKAVMDGASAWADIDGKVTMLPRNDQRKGPRGWVWDAGGKQLNLSQPSQDGDTNGRGWFRTLPGDINADNGLAVALYAPGKEPPPPTEQTPMNYVSADGALFVAALMGCRLPTAGEWQAASRSGGGGANRRDEAWAEQFRHLESVVSRAEPKDQMSLRNNLPWPAADTFAPPGTPSRPPAADGEPAVATNDGVIWFRPAPAGSPVLADLEGNVAEWVLDDGAEYARGALPGRAGLLEAIKARVRSADLRVVGASALSDATINPATPYAVRSVSAFWSDVGFRVAFTTSAGAGGGGKLVDRMVKILAESPYLSRE
jgi:hypothetical protein